MKAQNSSRKTSRKYFSSIITSDSRIALRLRLPCIGKFGDLHTEFLNGLAQNLATAIKLVHRNELTSAVRHPNIAGAKNNGLGAKCDHAGSLRTKRDGAGGL